MKEKAFTVYDSKSEIYSRPMYAATTEAGKRLFHQAVNQEGSQYGMYGGDYTLFEIGTWDDNKGEVTMHKVHVNHGAAIAYLDVASNHDKSINDMQQATIDQIEQQNMQLKTAIAEMQLAKSNGDLRQVGAVLEDIKA